MIEKLISEVEHKIEKRKNILILFSIFFLVAAVIFAIIGIRTLPYTGGGYRLDLDFGGYDLEALGGDLRVTIAKIGKGIAWNCVGIISAIIGCTLAILAKK